MSEPFHLERLVYVYAENANKRQGYGGTAETHGRGDLAPTALWPTEILIRFLDET
jgi:hypothetical protein